MSPAKTAQLRLVRITNLPVAALIALLQRTPVVQVAATAGEYALASPVAMVLRSAAAAAATLGVVNAVAGATSLAAADAGGLVASPYQATVGTPIPTIAFDIVGTESGTLPGSWTLGGSLPPGLSFNGSSSTGTTDTVTDAADNSALTGTPTKAGTYTIELTGYEFAGGASGNSKATAGGIYGGGSTGTTSSTFSFTIDVAAAAATTPSVTANPTGSTVTAGQSATFTAAASGSPNYQWQLSADGGASWANVPAGAPYSGQTTGTLTITGATAAMSGNQYRCIATNTAGSATSQAARLIVNKLAQTITFAAPVNRTYGSAPFAVSATDTSGLPVSFSIVSGPAAFESGKLAFTGVGTIVLAANQAGNATYSAAPEVTRSFAVAKGGQVITFTAPATKKFGIPSFPLSATSTSGLPVSFLKVTGPATVSGKTVTLTGVGIVTIEAYQSGNADYKVATTVTRSFTVAKGEQVITFTAIANKTFGNPPFTLSASSTSGLPVSFLKLTGPATISGKTVTLTGTGSVTIEAYQLGNADYDVATTVKRSFTVAP